MSTTGGIGHFVPWDGGCLLIGRSVGVIPGHAHYAVQVTLGSEPGVRFRSGDGPWAEYAGAVVPSRLPHSMDATGVPANAVLLVEPETREGRALAERYGQGGISAVSADSLSGVGPALFAAWRERRDPGAIAEAARQVVGALTGGVGPAVVSDDRVLRAVVYVKAHLDSPLTLGEVAAEAYLSPGRFRHLFAEETGMGLRPYVLWRRFLRVWELVVDGASLTEAAHVAGFADAAHLTRTSNRMFGFPPSAIRIDGPLGER